MDTCGTKQPKNSIQNIADWLKRIRNLGTTIFPIVVCCLLLGCGQSTVHNQLFIINDKGETIKTYNNIYSINVYHNGISFKCNDTIVRTNQLYRYESIYDNSRY